jgi:hypothetical protein
VGQDHDAFGLALGAVGDAGNLVEAHDHSLNNADTGP